MKGLTQWHIMALNCALAVLTGSYVNAQTIADSFQGTNSTGTNFFMGRVGVGTNDPAEAMELNATTPGLRMNGNSTKVRFLSWNDGLYIQAGTAWSSGSTQSIHFSGIYGTPIIMTIAGNNVGIGTTTPADKLAVNGSAKISGKLLVGPNYASNGYSLAQGYNTKAYGESSYAGGYESEARKAYSHAEGYSSIADGTYSHAEGRETYTYGSSAHAEGYGSYAIGEASHSEGFSTYTEGDYAHVEGYATYTFGRSGHSAGENAGSYHDHTYVWSDGEYFEANTNRQFSVYALNGIRLMGGPTRVERGGDISMGSFTNMP